MVREKVAPEYLEKEITYEESHWADFQQLRKLAFRFLNALKAFAPLLHGSIARGDITKKSDIDIIIPHQIKEFQISAVLDPINFLPIERWIVQATPLSAIKAVILFSSAPELTVTFPIIPFYPRENEFYHFGGTVGFEDLKKDLLIRVPGVNKQLMFIDPIETGHKEFRVTTENVSIIAKILSISVDTILERIRVLERRDQVGRTGIFKKRLLLPTESFGEVLREISATNPASRRRIKRKKIL